MIPIPDVIVEAPVTHTLCTSRGQPLRAQEHYALLMGFADVTCKAIAADNASTALANPQEVHLTY
eukprot:1873031-Amphidinium_carterae.1